MRFLVAMLALACRPTVGVHGGRDSAESGTEAVPPVKDSDSAADTADSVPPVVYEHLAILMVDTGGAAIPDGSEVPAEIAIIRDHDGTLDDLDTAPVDYRGPIGIELHGSSSLGFPKTPFRIEFRDEKGQDWNYPLLDMPSDSDWVLLASYNDKSLLRDALAFGLARAVAGEKGDWQPRTRFCELFVNGDYQGLYVVTERIRQDRYRIDVPELPLHSDDGDITGGYIVKVDQHRNEGWNTDLGTPIDYVYPHPEDFSAEQLAYLHYYFDAFESVLNGPRWDDSKVGYPAWIDVDSWVDHFLVNEISHNVDAYRLSAYLYKDADPDGGLLHAGPDWDFTIAFGNVDYCYCWQTEGFIIDSLTKCGYPDEFPFWWNRLLSDPAFQDRLRCRWDDLRADVLADEAIEAMQDEMTLEIADAEGRDQARWGTLGTYVWPNYYVADSWDQELRYLRAWTRDRVAWMDDHVPGTCEQR